MWAKRAAILLIILIAILAILCGATDFGHRSMFNLAILVALSNTIFISLILFLIAFLAARSYLNTGMHQILWLGAGALSFGLGSLLSASQVGLNTDVSMTIYNSGAVLAAIFFLHGIFPWSDTTDILMVKFRRNISTVLIYYSSIWIIMLLLYFLAYFQILPAYFISGASPTIVDNVFIGISSSLLVISFVVYIRTYFRRRINFYFWYSLALLLIAGGLILINIGPAGSPLAWLGRAAHYIGGLYFIPAIFSIVTQAREKGVDIDEVVASFFMNPRANYELLVEESSDAIFSTDQSGRIILWNTAASHIFGYSRSEAIGLDLWNLFTGESAKYLKVEFDKITGTATSNIVTDEQAELEAIKKSGDIFPVAISYSARKVPLGWITIIIARDITELKRAQAALIQANADLEIRVKQRTAELEIITEELRLLTSKLAVAEENERKRIATELHDDVGQVLAVCGLKLESILEQAPSELKESLEEILAMVQKLNEETNSLMFQLSPPVLYDLGLESAIEELTIRLQQQNNIEINVDWDGQPKHLGIELRIILFQLVRELLMNVVNHSKATSADISITQNENQLSITVADNGVGFVPQSVLSEAKKTRFGLLQIRERLRNIGGTLIIDSKKNQGTRVTVTVPLEKYSEI